MMYEYCDAIIDWGHVVATIDRERKNKEISKFGRQREGLPSMPANVRC